MTNYSLIENKIAAVEKYLETAEKYKKYPRNEIEKNIDLRGAVERYLYLAVQSCIDLSEAVVSFKNFRKPTTYREGFEILGEKDILTADLVDKMTKMAGFRNVIAHDYLKVDYGRVYDILQSGLSDIEEFISAIKKYLDIR